MPVYSLIRATDIFATLRKMSDNPALAAIAKSVGKRPVADLETVELANLKPSDIGKAVHVRVYRKWTVTSTRGARQSTLSFMLLDRQGGAIQANVDPRDKIRFDRTLQINDTYTITGFGLQPTKRWMQTLPNHFTMIFGRLTDVHPFSGTGFPLHHFNFAAYNELAARADDNEAILTDYIGCVLNVGDTRDTGNTTQKVTVWRDIVIRNLLGDTIRFTLWNENARNFDIDKYESAAKPTVIAVSSCWVKTYGGLQLSSSPATHYYYNPILPETDYILSMYDQLLPPPVIQNVRTYRYENIQQEKQRNRVTIDELLREDPQNQTNVRFTVVGTILEIISRWPWYFRRCRDCRHKIYNNVPHGHCPQPNPGEPNDYSYSFRASISDHTGTLPLTCFSDEAHSVVTECNKVVTEQGHTDPYTVPPALLELEGTTHLFQLHYAPESTKQNRAYILDTVMESGQHLLMVPEQNEPANIANEPPQTQMLLTGPEIGTQEGTSDAHDHAGPMNEDESGAVAEKPPGTPPTHDILQVSTPATAERTESAHETAAKAETARTSVRRQLMTTETDQGTCTATKKTRQEQ